MIYTVTFNPAIDYVVHLQGELKQEGINRNTAEEYQFGGKGHQCFQCAAHAGRGV